MRLIEDKERPEEHFTEGELDLEAPEELAIGELDDDTLLEEDLDNEDVDEQDVDDVVLEVTLEDLVHSADGDEDEEDELGHDARPLVVADLTVSLRTPEPAFVEGNGSGPAAHDGLDELDDLDDLEVVDLEDAEESLDHILAERLAGDAEAAVDQEEDEPEGSPETAWPILLHIPGHNGSEVSPCRDDEFVCGSCFLVRKRAQLADASRSICRDCSG